MNLPDRFLYESDSITEEEERLLLKDIGQLTFTPVTLHGVTARRRVIHYGRSYDFESRRLASGPPIPEFLRSLRVRSADMAQTSVDELAEALITEYPPEASIGWHRDAPQFGRIVGISLLSPCRLRFRRGEGEMRTRAETTLAPRSAYVLRGSARASWQHSIPAVKATRYSITFRTLRGTPGKLRK